MMSLFTARLEACDPARDCFRSYRLDAGPDLFGAWLVEATYGRIGAPAGPCAMSPRTKPRPAASSASASSAAPRLSSGSALPTAYASSPTLTSGYPILEIRPLCSSVSGGFVIRLRFRGVCHLTPVDLSSDSGSFVI